MAQTVKKPPTVQETRVGKIPWRREWLPTTVFLPGEFHSPRTLAGYSPWGHEETRLSDSLFHVSESIPQDHWCLQFAQRLVDQRT